MPVIFGASFYLHLTQGLSLLHSCNLQRRAGFLEPSDQVTANTLCWNTSWRSRKTLEN